MGDLRSEFGRNPTGKLALDLRRGSTLGVAMTLSDEERAELPRELFAMAARRLEHGNALAMKGQGCHSDPERLQTLGAQLHDVGEDLKVIADAIAVLAEYEARQ